MSPRRVLVLGPGADGMRLAGDGGLAASSLGMTVISGPGACNCRMGARSLPLCGLRVPAPGPGPSSTTNSSPPPSPGCLPRRCSRTSRTRSAPPPTRTTASGPRTQQRNTEPSPPPWSSGHSSPSATRYGPRSGQPAPGAPGTGKGQIAKKLRRTTRSELQTALKPGYLEMASGCQCDFERWVMVGEVAPLGHGLNIAEEGHERCRLISAPSGKTRRAKRTRREMHAHLSRHRQAG